MTSWLVAVLAECGPAGAVRCAVAAVCALYRPAVARTAHRRAIAVVNALAAGVPNPATSAGARPAAVSRSAAQLRRGRGQHPGPGAGLLSSL